MDYEQMKDDVTKIVSDKNNMMIVVILLIVLVFAYKTKSRYLNSIVTNKYLFVLSLIAITYIYNIGMRFLAVMLTMFLIVLMWMNYNMLVSEFTNTSQMMDFELKNKK